MERRKVEFKMVTRYRKTGGLGDCLARSVRAGRRQKKPVGKRLAISAVTCLGMFGRTLMVDGPRRTQPDVTIPNTKLPNDRVCNYPRLTRILSYDQRSCQACSGVFRARQWPLCKSIAPNLSRADLQQTFHIFHDPIFRYIITYDRTILLVWLNLRVGS
jgi:hypothetical protein